MTQEVLKLALEALEQWHFGCGAGSASHDDAVAAIKKALEQPRYLEIPGMRIDPVTGNFGIGSLPAQPQQEPVALEEKFSLLLWDYQELERAFEKVTGGKWVRKSNTPQRIWVGLTPEQVQFYAALHRQLEVVYYDATLDTNVITETFNATDFYQQVESELKELNK